MPSSSSTATSPIELPAGRRRARLTRESVQGATAHGRLGGSSATSRVSAIGHRRRRAPVAAPCGGLRRPRRAPRPAGSAAIIASSPALRPRAADETRPASRSPASPDDQVLVGADALAAPEHGGDPLLRPEGLVVALDQLSRLGVGELVGAAPAAVCDLVAGAEAEPDRHRPPGIDVGEEVVAGRGAVRVDQPVQLLGGLAGEALPDVASAQTSSSQASAAASSANGRGRTSVTLVSGSGVGAASPPSGCALPRRSFGPARGAPRVLTTRTSGFAVRLAVGPQQVAAVTGPQPAGQIQLGERE